MKFGVVIFPGSNCDRDMVHVLSNVMRRETETIWHKSEQLGTLTTDDCVVLPGGFSYGDYLRTGAIARFSPVMEAVAAHAAAGGKVLGICNGFQVLCEAGLLPGALLRNNHMKYVCTNVFIKAQTRHSLITRFIPKDKVLTIPIAHGEGRYYADAETLRSLEDNDQILFRYCNAEGQYGEDWNPNGSLLNIAGICNRERNVFGMMPHPERAAEAELGNTDGKHLFDSLCGIFKNYLATA